MTVEEIELRKILTQMLADNGINRETLVPFVKGIIDEKVNVAIDRVMHDYEPKLERIVTDAVKDNATYAVRETIRSTVRKALQDMNIQVHLSGLPLSKGDKNAKS